MCLVFDGTVLKGVAYITIVLAQYSIAPDEKISKISKIHKVQQKADLSGWEVWFRF